MPETPQDHKPGTLTKPRKVTVQGVALTIDPNILDDFRIVDELYDLQSGDNAFAVVPLLRRILGDDYRRVLDALEDPATRRVPTEAVTGFITELFKRIAPNS